jgi:hypothetical protein
MDRDLVHRQTAAAAVKHLVRRGCCFVFELLSSDRYIPAERGDACASCQLSVTLASIHSTSSRLTARLAELNGWCAALHAGTRRGWTRM